MILPPSIAAALTGSMNSSMTSTTPNSFSSLTLIVFCNFSPFRMLVWACDNANADIVFLSSSSESESHQSFRGPRLGRRVGSISKSLVEVVNRTRVPSKESLLEDAGRGMIDRILKEPVEAVSNLATG